MHNAFQKLVPFGLNLGQEVHFLICGLGDGFSMNNKIL